jgi:hypothetical protein
LRELRQLTQQEKQTDGWEILKIIYEQKSLIQDFIETGDQKLVARFKELCAQFQNIHQSHKLKLGENQKKGKLPF